MKRLILVGLGVGVISLFFVIPKTFADDGELNSTNITQAPFNCAIDATNCDLSNQDIDSIAADTFVNHYNLQILNLSRNRLTELPVGLFDPLTGLLVLNLAYNEIVSL